MRLRVLTWMGAVFCVATVISIYVVMTWSLEPLIWKRLAYLVPALVFFAVLSWFFQYKSGPFLPNPKKRWNWKWLWRSSNPVTLLLLVAYFVFVFSDFGVRGILIGVAAVLLAAIPLVIFHLLTRRIAAALPPRDPRIFKR